MLGVVDLVAALDKANAVHLDLVEISPQAKPPVCKLMDYGKYRYQQQKKLKEAKKHQTVTHIKEVKVRLNIATHDYQVKLRNARRFIEDKDKVKVSLRFRGREIAHNDIGRELMKRFATDMEEVAKVEQAAKMEGRQLAMILTPL